MKYAITMLLVGCVLVGCVLVRSASAEFIIRTDTTLNFPISFSVGSVSVIDGDAGPTTVDIVDGAVISPDVSVTDHSVLNLRGGETQRGVGAGGFATINVFGGLVAGEDISMGGHSTANIYGGILGDDIHASESSVVNLYGGTFEGFGVGAMLLVQDDGVINVFGSDLEIDLDPPGAPFPQLQGFLSDGSPLDVRLFDNGATLGLEQIVLHQIPEPSTFSLCLIGLFLLLLIRRVRGRPVTRPSWQARRREITASRVRAVVFRRVARSRNSFHAGRPVMKYAIAMLLVSCVMVRSASAEFLITTDTTINYPISLLNDSVVISDGVAGPTTVEIVDGADINPSVGVRGHSVLNIRGGITHRTVGVSDQSTLNVFGGLVGGQDISVGDHATANLYGGIYGDDINASGSAVVYLYGGTFEGNGKGAFLLVKEDGVINVFGSDFEITLDPSDPPFPRLRGFLSDGSPLDVHLITEELNLGSAEIVLHEIPEPSAFSMCLLGLFLLLLHGRVRGRVAILSYGRATVETKLPAASEQSDRKSHSQTGGRIIKYAIATLLVCCVMVRSASAELFITTDTTLDFFIASTDGFVIISDGIGGPTTVEIVDGADIQPSVVSHDRTVLNIRGGITHRAVGMTDQSTLNVYGGLVGGEAISVGDNATANLYDGIYQDDIRASGSAVVNLYGGTFEGKGGATLLVREDGVINVFGWDFEIGPDPSGSPFPRLQGFLSDGSPFDVRIITEELNLGSAAIVLHDIPEPSAFSLGLLGLFLVMLNRRVRGRPETPPWQARRRETATSGAQEPTLRYSTAGDIDRFCPLVFSHIP